MTCLSLLASTKFTQKRYAYLGICILLDEKSEVLLLTSHTIKKDLENRNQFIVASALNAIGEIATPDMCRDTCNEVIKCLSSSNPYIKKKAALALSKIIRLCPELVDTVASRIAFIFEDKNHGVLISGLALVIQIFKADPSYIKKNKKYVPILLKTLKNLTANSYAPEYDVNGVTDPFLQAKILETLAYFGKIEDEENEEMSNLLGSLPNSTETSTKNTGNAVLYELVKTIFSYESSNGLRTLASSILGKFLANKDNNYKYIAMNSLMDIARIDLNSVQKHKNIILEFLNDSDIAIKRKSLDLTYLIVNEGNIKQIMKECLNFLNTTDSTELMSEVTQKIFSILETYSPSLKWEIDNLLKMLCIAEDNVSDELINKIINLIIDSKDLHQYSMFRFFISMKSNMDQEGLLRVGVYLLGELAHLIIGVTAVVGENESVTINEKDIVDLIIKIVNDKNTSESLHETLMNCCFKLLGKLSNENSQKLKEVLEQESKSFYCEVQERANEYMVFTQIANPQMQQSITQNIPVNKNLVRDSCDKNVVVDEYENEKEKNYYNNLITNKGAVVKAVESHQAMNIASPTFSEPAAAESKSEPSKSAEQTNPSQGGMDLFGDIGSIFGGPSTTTQPTQQPSQPAAGGNDNLFNLLDMMGGAQPQPQPQQNNFAQPSPMNPQPAAGGDLLSQLGNLYGNQPSQPQPQPASSGLTDMFGGFNTQPAQSSNAMKEVYKNNEVSIYSQFTGGNNSYQGNFFISNNTPKNLNNVKLNFLVKKHITFKVASTSGNTLGPNASLGIKKEVSLQNNDPSKPIVIKMNLSYNVDGRDVSESAMINGI